MAFVQAANSLHHTAPDCFGVLSDKLVGGLGEVLCSFADETDKLRRLAAPACEDLRCSFAVDSIYLLAEELGKAAQLLCVLQLSVRNAVLIDYNLEFFGLVVLRFS